MALLGDLDAEIVEVSCPHFAYALPAYYLIAPSEAFGDLARSTACATAARRYDGVASAKRSWPHPRRRFRAQSRATGA